MPRDLPLGNGRLLVSFDARWRLRELFFPQVGMENHLMGRPCRVGLRDGSHTSWVGDDGWKVALAYEDDTLVSAVRASSAALDLTVRATEAVDPEATAFVRHITVVNGRSEPRSIRLFLHHDLDILESDAAQTAFYDPALKALIHYKRRRYFLLNVMVNGVHGVPEWSTGARRHRQGRGTAGQAEDDGRLDGNAIAQGAVDSCIAVDVELPASGEASIDAWMIAGTRYQDVDAAQAQLLHEGPAALLQRTRAYWRSWVRRHDGRLKALPPDIADLHRRSLLVISTQIDAGGAILAANDGDIYDLARDGYSYVWPRDGALVAEALDRAGHPDAPRRFFKFAAEHVSSGGYFLHKYAPDGSLASSWHPWIRNGRPELPIQEDSTALVVWAIGEHLTRSGDMDFVAPLWTRLVRPAADFMDKFRHPVTKLPEPSWDLWEERHGVHAFTVAATFAAMNAASRIAAVMGDEARSVRYAAAADEIRSGLDTFLFHKELGRYVRTGTPEGNGYWLDVTLDASLAGLFLFGMVDADDPRLVATLEAVETRLTIGTSVGGIARYENDWYHRVSDDITRIPGNPWFICTLWLAEWRIARAKTRADLDPVLETLDWVRRRAHASGVMAEQLHPETGAPLSVSPLTWSHAQYVSTTLSLAAAMARFDAPVAAAVPHHA